MRKLEGRFNEIDLGASDAREEARSSPVLSKGLADWAAALDTEDSSQRWRRNDPDGTLDVVMQAFSARPPPLATGPDGVVRVVGTRVPLETIVTAFDAGATAEEIAQQYPSVDLPSVYAVISYVLDRRSEVDDYVARRSKLAAKVRDDIEAKSPPEGFRARLLARRSPPAAE